MCQGCWEKISAVGDRVPLLLRTVYELISQLHDLLAVNLRRWTGVVRVGLAALLQTSRLVMSQSHYCRHGS